MNIKLTMLLPNTPKSACTAPLGGSEEISYGTYWGLGDEIGKGVVDTGLSCSLRVRVESTGVVDALSLIISRDSSLLKYIPKCKSTELYNQGKYTLEETAKITWAFIWTK